MQYRLYLFSPADRVRFVDLDCESDAEAIQAVEDKRTGLAMELWQRGRLVAKFPAVLEPERTAPARAETEARI